MGCIETVRGIVLGVRENGADADMLGNGKGPQDRVAQHSPPHSLPLMLTVHGKSCEHHDRDGVPGQTLFRSRRGRNMIHASGGQTVVTGDPSFIVSDHEGTGSARLLILDGVTVQPQVERGDAAIEGIEPVFRRQRRRGFQSHGALVLRRRLSSGLRRAGLSSAAWNAFHSLLPTGK